MFTRHMAKQNARKVQARKNQRKGSDAEEIIEHRLRNLGLLHVKKIHTGMRKVAGRWIHAEKVEGDFYAVMPKTCKHVHVEVKCKATKLANGSSVLRYSAIEKHQVDALNNYARIGCIALIVWMVPQTKQIFIMQWPIPQFIPNSSLTVEMAANNHIFNIKDIY